MKIQTITEENLDIICSICLDPSVDKETKLLMENGMENRINWIKEMMLKGLEILVAFEKPRDEKIHYKWVGKILHSDLAIRGQVPMGLVEFIPIEHALEPINGEKMLFIDCIWILPPFWHSGVATALIESLIEKAKPVGGVGVIAYDGDSWFDTSIKYMSSSFFKKLGFKEVDRDGTRVLLYYDLGSSIPPKFILPKSKDITTTKKLNLDIFFNSQCPWSKYMVNTVTSHLKNNPKININIINTDDKELIKLSGISRGVILNGKPIIKRMASIEEIQLEIEKY
ncbi:MAG: GNAT family N-acetyltransferase [Candidatus Thorarchaeota archaeon]